MKKVLWFSNCSISKAVSSGSGSWLFAMRDLIVNDVELINITEGPVRSIEIRNGNGIKEYVLPTWKTRRGVPYAGNIEKIARIIHSESPDIIHIWGVEKYWALLFSRGFLNSKNVILEIQGVLSACVDVYYGGLTPKECRKQVSLKSALFSKYRLSATYRTFQKKAAFEEELVRSFNNIAVQSVWTKDQLSTICNEKTSFYFSLRPIRQEFYKAKKWKKNESGEPVIFCSLSYFKPFKGLHLLIKALKVLSEKYPSITLRVAGPNLIGRPFYYNADYERYIIREIKRLRLELNVHFCGYLNASQMVSEIQNADVVVNPSLVESYSAASAESLYLGAPTVLAYAGAMVNYSDSNPVALYYSPLDYRSLSVKIDMLLSTSGLRQIITKNAIGVLEGMCSPEIVKERQLETYNSVYLKSK